MNEKEAELVKKISDLMQELDKIQVMSLYILHALS